GGVHGANRLSGNAFAQIVTQGTRAGEAAAAFATREGEAGAPEAASISAATDRLETPLRRDPGATASQGGDSRSPRGGQYLRGDRPPRNAPPPRPGGHRLRAPARAADDRRRES